ncbi:hypothetical protein E3E12_06255 [Formicincola oecophyllae]|uniref:Uncharacterized protein n=1 Tax=Formicincola oecophyllae TaxID=2558361 RepID=A0A4Y6UCK6_9PROT|nr:hypothetical protein [Formicincola oecophyllae]QDH13855.1 hypothetical protein E3E12_06255 [Formicincola oecophyllae]
MATVPPLPASILRAQSPEYTFDFGLSDPTTALKGRISPAPYSFSATLADQLQAEKGGDYNIASFQNSSERHVALDIMSFCGVPTLTLKYGFCTDGKITAGTASIHADIKLVAGFGPMLRSLDLIWPSGFGADSTGTTSIIPHGKNAKLFTPNAEGGIFNVPDGQTLINALKVSKDLEGFSRFSSRNRSITTVRAKDNDLLIDAARRGSECHYAFAFGNEEGRRLFIEIADAISGKRYIRVAFSEDGVHFHGFKEDGKTLGSRLFLCNQVDDNRFGKMDFFPG